MTKLLLLDKDGTLTQPASGAKFTNAPTDQAPIPGATEAIARYAAAGWTIVIVSNQGGVAAGHKSLDDAIAEMRFALKLFTQIHEAYFCPCSAVTAGDRCWLVSAEPRIKPIELNQADMAISEGFRKPNPGMLLTAIATWREQGNEINEAECLMVGDRLEDQQAAAAADVPFQWADEWRGDNGIPF